MYPAPVERDDRDAVSLLARGDERPVVEDAAGVAERAPAGEVGREDPEPRAEHSVGPGRVLHRLEGRGGQYSPREEGGVEAGEVVRVRDDRARRPGKVRVVAAVCEIRQAARRRQLRPLKRERSEDALLELLCVRASSDLLDHETERDVVRVRIALPAAGPERQRLGGREAQALDGTGRGRPIGLVEPSRIVRYVREPRAVTEQVPDRDLLASRDNPRHVVFQRAVEAKRPLLHELEHDRGRERLRHAPDAEALIRLGMAGTRRGRVLLAPDGDEDDHALRPRRYLSQHTPDGRRRAPRLFRPCRRRRGDHADADKQSREHAQPASHDVRTSRVPSMSAERLSVAFTSDSAARSRRRS